MEDELRALHLHAGRIAGEEKTCGKKVRYPSEDSATRAAADMNAKPTTRKPLEAYPCAFCAQWHIGRAMSIEELRSYVTAEPQTS